MLTKEEFDNLELRYNETDINKYDNVKIGEKIFLYNNFYTVYSYKNQLVVNILYNNYNKRHSCILSIRKLIYCFNNKLDDIPIQSKIIHIDGDVFNNNIFNLRLISNILSETQIKDYNFKYKYINTSNILTLENARIGDIIPLYDRNYRVKIRNDTRLYIRIKYICYDGRKVRRYIPLNEIIYEYYNSNQDYNGKKLFYIDNNIFNNKIDNLRLINNTISKKDFYNWNFRYRYINESGISRIINCKPGDIIPFCDRSFTVGINHDGRYIISINLYNGIINEKLYSVFIYRLIFEYYHGIILNSDDLIHHIDENPFNNNINNLLLVNKSEHNKIHGDKKRIINDDISYDFNLDNIENYNSVVMDDEVYYFIEN